ncbi:glycosyltransferase family 4 protein [Patescibacteria group bacterium]|nr:glycosyltransferase family 4 protein [Patescibacteria group bacterium]
MKIAIDAADLCDKRIDGTRIYIKNVLDHLGHLSPADNFFIYSKGRLNPALKFKKYSNYTIRCSSAPFFWTQLKFPFELKKDKPDVLWMPLQTVPYLIPSDLKVVVTIHDLAFKIFPHHFPAKDCFLLNLFTKKAIKQAAKIIAVSKNTKQDIIKYYQAPASKIQVIYHGFNRKIFNPKTAQNPAAIKKIKNKFKIKKDYLLYVGAIQPRKNLSVLLKAFETVKENQSGRELSLVLAGPRAWLNQIVFKQIQSCRFASDIIFTGPFKTRELPGLLGAARAFVFPSLYEGFGIPVLEAMASGTPVISSDNSSLPEVGGGAPQYFNAQNSSELAAIIKNVLDSPGLQKSMRQKGLEQARKFSWEKCAKLTSQILTDHK